MSSIVHSEPSASADEIVTRTCVIIPALNEEAALPRVISDLRHFGLERIRAVDNGSHDHTARVATESGAHVLSEP